MSDLRRYLPVYKAIMKGDWESAKRLLAQDKSALTAYVTANNETLLHRAVGTHKAIDFLEKLVELMPWEALALRNYPSETALCTAARLGNTKAAMILVDKNPALLQMKNNDGLFPVHLAALYAHKETLLYLMKATIDHHHPTPYADQYSGVRLLVHVIDSGFLDVALDLVQRDPDLATFIKLDNGDYPLLAITKKPSAFPSGCRLNFWQRFIYSRVPVKLENYSNNPNAGDIENPNAGDIENPADNCQWPKLHVLLAKVMELVTPIKHIREEKLRHLQALQLVKCLCQGMYSFSDYYGTGQFFENAYLESARMGIHEILEELVDTIPDSTWYMDADGRYIFQIAVVNRNENVFNLVYQMSEHKQYITHFRDNFNNTILHLAGKLAPPHKLNLVSGAALQMQRELQWFKEVEKFVIPAYKEMENNAKKTPAMVFSEEHKDLVSEGEKWMKETANSCTIAAALIATVVFAAAITVPGGNNADGLPMFSKQIGFIIFAVSDAISLFTSTASLLMFLSILTSRYAEQDFLYSLPKRLIIGLVTLFLSITSMMITFSATLYLVFGHRKGWILIPVAALACLPVTLFVSLQFPLLVDVISSTYGPGIFSKQSDRSFF
ncbi:protein ACCELERATED CELL DEATH 6-like [Cornus florida]|uniref:protein ACCELERATED CELL DEATH 6-like n=1 Tax=Cornus florida TaxID=4283 RepID=UPI002897F692|nr:protein ACCELERATED CELL DEATH 6-like [Cornus florida]XP_059633231.1 protein ACCELERATED CELL DEATH 6-like [Cornus florida]